jgi:hypothetical protein
MISDAMIGDRWGGFTAVVVAADRVGGIYGDGRIVGGGKEMTIMRSGIVQIEGEVEELVGIVMDGGGGGMGIVIRCS